MSDTFEAITYVCPHCQEIRRVAARALREAAADVYGDKRAEGPYSHPLSIADWLRDRADRIEAGEQP